MKISYPYHVDTRSFLAKNERVRGSRGTDMTSISESATPFLHAPRFSGVFFFFLLLSFLLKLTVSAPGYHRRDNILLVFHSCELAFHDG